MNGHSLDSIDDPSEDFFEPPSFDEEKERRAGFFENHESIPQKQQVLKWIEAHGTITQAEALTHLEVGRLASRIYNLKEDGYDIDKVMITVKNKKGKKCSVAKYFIKT